MLFKAEGSMPLQTKDVISWIFDDVPYDQDMPIYIDAANPSNSISSRQARTLIRKLAAGFRAGGVKKGDVVCLHSFNDIYYPILVLGIIAAGGIFAGANPSSTQHENAHHIKTSKTSFIISEPEILDAVVSAATECDIPLSNIWIFDILGQAIPKGFRSWKELLQHGEEDWERFDDLETAKNTTATRLFSSGTTGLPKAAELSHYNLVAQHTMVYEARKKSYDISRLYAIPMFHAAAAPSAHFSTLKGGQVAYIMRRFELEPFFANLEKYSITDLIVVPPMAIAMIMSPLNKKYSLKKVKLAVCGAAPLDKGPQARFQALLSSETPLVQVWGMTEASCIATMFNYPEKDTTGGVGRLIPNLEAKIIDDEGKNISAYNTQGEICLRGPTVIKGYFENPKANAESFDSDGWYKTGDIGYCDERSKVWYIVDRKKELIKVRAFQVAPPELEGVLMSHPQIVDAAVIGIQLTPDTELPRAYIVRRPTPEGAKLTEKEVFDFTAEKLSRYKRLEGGVKFVESIPKNASGKILKRILREQAKTEIQQEGGRPRL